MSPIVACGEFIAGRLSFSCPVRNMKLIKYGIELYNLTLGSNEALYP